MEPLSLKFFKERPDSRWSGLADRVVFGHGLNSVIPEVISKLNGSVILAGTGTAPLQPFGVAPTFLLGNRSTSPSPPCPLRGQV